ncbi:MAG TPA: aromatic ring-hydroxylating dioxygenase subunit alpha [Euzebyales bacterium]|nr:aromatic ring-hydroxylating dioxygenase subunit alpha [Euzebyales bacterium]
MTSTPLQLDGVDRALLPFGESRMLPAQCYTSGAVFAWERRAFLAGSWFCAGRADELRGDGTTQVATTAGDVGVLLTWDGDDVRAFANVCRHRGHELLADGHASPRRTVLCPYHAWTYDLAGNLRGAPGFRDMAAFDPDAHGLVSLPVQTWHGWVFVNATGDAPPFAEHLGGLAELIAPYAPERLFRRERHDYELAANWKVIAENYHECYHCPLIHPELCAVSPPTSGRNWKLPGAWIGGVMDLAQDADTMSLDGRSHAPAIPGADPREVAYVQVFPNLLISAHPDYVMTHRLVPTAVDRTLVECSWYFVDPDVDPSYAVEFWDLTNRQDWAACESVQRGLASPHFSPGPLAPNEDAVYDFVAMAARGYLGRPLATT